MRRQARHRFNQDPKEAVKWLVAGGSASGCLALWDVRRLSRTTSAVAAAPKNDGAGAVHRVQGAHLGAVRSVCFCGQRELLSCGDDGRILRWRVGMSSAGLSIDAGFGMGMHGGMGMGAERHHLQLHGEEKWDGEGVAAQLPLNALDISNGLLLAASDAQFVVCMRAARYA